tara:strand:+ start:304 stop:468 length:165 start_codon:yes stop_codon:yes gene_type:complete
MDVKSSYASEMKRKINYLRGKKGEESPAKEKVPKLVINIEKKGRNTASSRDLSP